MAHLNSKISLEAFRRGLQCSVKTSDESISSWEVGCSCKVLDSKKCIKVLNERRLELASLVERYLLLGFFGSNCFDWICFGPCFKFIYAVEVISESSF